MSETTKIEWAEHTGGPHLGCSCVSPGCANCYAMKLARKRLERIFRSAYQKAGFADWATRPVWGDKATRVLAKGFWAEARRMNARHAKAGTRGRWFPSMIDWLDKLPAGIIDQDGKRLDPVAVLADFLKLIFETPNLDWLLLTKRPENFRPRLEQVLEFLEAMEIAGGFGKPGRMKLFELREFMDFVSDWIEDFPERISPPANVWIGVSVEDQQRADERIPELLKIPARVRFLSVEPMLEKIDLVKGIVCAYPAFNGADTIQSMEGIDWVIFGGESGPGARACNVEWIRDGVKQCREAGVPAFVKQLGANRSWALKPGEPFHQLKDSKGGDMAEWPGGSPQARIPNYK